MANPKKHPITGRRVIADKGPYNELMAEAERVLAKRGSLPSSSSRASSKSRGSTNGSKNRKVDNKLLVKRAINNAKRDAALNLYLKDEFPLYKPIKLGVFQGMLKEYESDDLKKFLETYNRQFDASLENLDIDIVLEYIDDFLIRHEKEFDIGRESYSNDISLESHLKEADGVFEMYGILHVYASNLEDDEREDVPEELVDASRFVVSDSSGVSDAINRTKVVNSTRKGSVSGSMGGSERSGARSRSSISGSLRASELSKSSAPRSSGSRASSESKSESSESKAESSATRTASERLSFVESQSKVDELDYGSEVADLSLIIPFNMEEMKKYVIYLQLSKGARGLATLSENFDRDFQSRLLELWRDDELMRRVRDKVRKRVRGRREILEELRASTKHNREDDIIMSYLDNKSSLLDLSYMIEEESVDYFGIIERAIKDATNDANFNLFLNKEFDANEDFLPFHTKNLSGYTKKVYILTYDESYDDVYDLGEIDEAFVEEMRASAAYNRGFLLNPTPLSISDVYSKGNLYELYGLTVSMKGDEDEKYKFIEDEDSEEFDIEEIESGELEGLAGE